MIYLVWLLMALGALLAGVLLALGRGSVSGARPGPGSVLWLSAGGHPVASPAPLQPP
jgi:hypothetical protein